MSETDSAVPMTIYGPELSYFTGKLEAVIRYMEIPYQRVAAAPMGESIAATGVAQVPALQLADGRWLTDSTPIISWLAERYPGAQVIPENPVQAFFSKLLEDYADEWLWRPAMHYRWDYAESAAHQSWVLADELGQELRVPHIVKRYLIRNRQRSLFTRGDGVSDETWDHVEKSYLDTLQQFTDILGAHPYLLGSRPSLADFGFFGPMFRHFSMDPTSARIMRETAPAVFEWVARVWNERLSRVQERGGSLVQGVPENWGPILDSIGSTYLPYLCANAEAWKSQSEYFDVAIESAPYKHIRTSVYRVWCLEELRREFNVLSDTEQKEAQSLLEIHGCWEPLWRIKDTASGVDPQRQLPFAGGVSMTGVPQAQSGEKHWMPRLRMRGK